MAKEAYDAALALETKAASDLGAGSFTSAADGFDAATKGFAAALDAARSQVEGAAKEAQAAMKAAKRAADEQNAKANATGEYSGAENLESIADASFAARDFPAAKTQYEDAAARYEKAATASKSRAGDPDYATAVAAQKAMDGAKAACARIPAPKKPSPQFYSWAQQKEEQGKRALRANQLKIAAKAFDDSRIFYTKAAETAK